MRHYQHFFIYEQDYLIYLNGYFIFTNEDKDNLIEQIKSINADIVSPLIKNKETLIYFGGYSLENNIYYIDHQLIELKSIKTTSSFFFTRQTQLYYQDLFICKKTFYLNSLFNKNIDNHQLNSFTVFVTPFIQINTKNQPQSHKIIHPYNFEDKYLKFSFLQHQKYFNSFKLESFKSIIHNQKRNILLLINQKDDLNTLKHLANYFLNLDVNLFVYGDLIYNDNHLFKKMETSLEHFNPKTYLYLNRDLQHLRGSEILLQYLEEGKTEGREISLPNNFNWKTYLWLNPDIKIPVKRKLSVENHYLKHGSYEFRNYQYHCNKNLISKKMNTIDYLRFLGIYVNIYNIKLERFLKINNNLFDYIFIIEPRFYTENFKIISKICQNSKIFNLSNNLFFFKNITSLNRLPLSISPEPTIFGKICILYQCYYRVDNCLEILKYFQSINKNYIYHLIIINNNEQLSFLNMTNEQTQGYITYLKGDNRYREMSAYQLGINYIRDSNLISDFGSFILMNETLFTNFPLHIHTYLDYNHLNKIMRNPLVMGKIDKNNNDRVFTLDGFKIEKWIRSNFLLFNQQIFQKILSYEIVYYTPEKCYHNEQLTTPMDKKLARKIDKWLSKERYKQLSGYQYQLKVSTILNEYRLSNYLSTFCNLTPI